MPGWKRSLRLSARQRRWIASLRAALHGWYRASWRRLFGRARPSVERLEERATPGSLLPLAASLGAAAIVRAAEPPSQTPVVERPSALADSAMDSPTETDKALADRVFSQAATQADAFSEGSRFLASADSFSSADEATERHTIKDAAFDPVMVAANALIDPLSNSAANAADGAKASPHQAGSPVGNGVSGTPPNLAGVGAGAGRGSGGPSTPFAAGGGSAGGGGGGNPVGGNLATLANEGAFSGSMLATTGPTNSTPPVVPTPTGNASAPSSIVSVALPPSHVAAKTDIAPNGKPANDVPQLFAPYPTPTANRPLTTQTIVSPDGASDPSGNAIRNLAGFTTNTLAANDDDSVGPVNLGFNLTFGGQQYSSVYVNDNGNVTFVSKLGDYTPYDLTSAAQPIIAPFFADVDTRDGNLVSYGTDTVDGHAAFGVDWFNVNYFNVQASDHVNLYNTFQLVLIDRSDVQPGAFEIEFNYGNINWETGDASGGTNGLGGTSAYVGYSDGGGTNGNWYQFAGSGVPGSFLDSNANTGLIYNSLNSGGVIGRYDFLIGGNLQWQGPTFTWTQTPAANPTVTAPADQTNTEGDNVSLQVQASDPKGNPLSYDAVDLPPGLSIDPTTGLISGTVQYDDAEDFDGSYNPTIIVANNQGGSTQTTFNWTINQAQVAPTLTNPGDQSNLHGDNVSLQLSASQVDNDPLTYDADNLPLGLSIDPDTGLISGTVDPSAATGTPYAVTVTATDEATNLTTSQTFNWTVNAANTAPVLTSPGDQSNAVGDVVSLQLAATDADDNPLTYTATGLPPGLTLDPIAGTITGTLPNSAASSTPYSVTVTASDGTYSSSQTFNWTVNPISLSNPGDQSNLDGDSVSLQMSATDAANGTLSYSATGLPSGLNINSGTGLISGTIDNAADTSSPYTVTVTASDDAGNSTNQSFTWTVAALALNPVNDQENQEGTAVALQVSATDKVGTPTYSATGLPNGLSIDAATGLISGTIDAAAHGSSPYEVMVTAADGGNTSNQSFVWTVTPRVALVNPGPQSNATGDNVSLQLSATSPGGTIELQRHGTARWLEHRQRYWPHLRHASG